jgi:hypothetical protein
VGACERACTASSMASRAAASASTTFFFFSLNLSSMVAPSCRGRPARESPPSPPCTYTPTRTEREITHKHPCKQTHTYHHVYQDTHRCIVGLKIFTQALGQILHTDGRVHNHQNVAVAKALTKHPSLG